MKKSFRLIAAVLAFCVAAAALPPPALAAGGTVHTLPSGTEWYTYFASHTLKDGDVIRCSGSMVVGTQNASDDPWIIDKAVTIEVGDISIHRGGILLGADVTFRNTSLYFTNSTRNAIIANGYSLTLDGVTAPAQQYSYNVFCGTLVPNTYETSFFVPACGSSNTLTIQGKTSLQGSGNVVGSGNIYAGTLCMGAMNPTDNFDGEPTEFSGNVTINIEDSANSSALGTVYAGGAQQRNPFNIPAQKSTTPNPDKYRVAGTVTVTGAAIPNVDGSGSGAANVVYQGGDEATRTFQNISSLTAASGSLVLTGYSYFRNGGTLTLNADAKLDLKQFPDRIAALQGGGGILVLKQDQTLYIDGAVEGTTSLAIGSTRLSGTELVSTEIPATEHVYIQAPNSADDSFVLLPPAGKPDMKLERNSSGGWRVPAAVTEVSKLISLEPKNIQTDSKETEATIPLNPTYTGDPLGLENLPLTIRVNNKEAQPVTDSNGDYYAVDNLRLYVGNYDVGEAFAVCHADGTYVTPLPGGAHTIEITVPGKYTSTGQDITAFCALTVGEAEPVPVSITIQTPASKTEYQKDEPLDVTGLTILVHYSNNSTQSVTVTPDMISGFDSSSPAESQILTIHYADKSTSYTIKIAGGQTPEDHTHVWSAAWSSDGTHHWHNCTASGCFLTLNSQKDAYAAHTAGSWVVDRPATSTQSGTRHRSCTVCNYELARETIPATGGGSSSGGSSSSSGGSSSGSTTTVKNPDGSTTATNTNTATGTVTETTRRPDGSRTVVETKKDGTVTTTDTAKDGSTVKTVERPDGATETTIKRADGLTASVQESQNSAKADVRLPARLTQGSAQDSVALPIPALPGEDASITIHTGSTRPVSVKVPVYGNENTTVACLVNSDGSETILKTAVLFGGQIALSVSDGATVHIRDNRKDFQDVREHWARSAIDFVSARELFAGNTSSTFAPDSSMSRAMLMTVLARLDGADTASGSAYEQGMAWAVSQGISDGLNPDAQVTREQFVTMLYRYAGSPASAGRELRFTDAENISGYAQEAIRWAVENGVLSGYEDGSLNPGGKTTRGQAASMLARYVSFFENKG